MLYLGDKKFLKDGIREMNSTFIQGERLRNYADIE
ncbi:unnamed protein product, partial [Rotaria socialis]